MKNIFKITIIFNLLFITNNSFSMLILLNTVKSICNSKKLTPVKTSAQLKEEITKLEILPVDLENLIIEFANPEYELEYCELYRIAKDNQDDINILKQVCIKSKLLIEKLTKLKVNSKLIEDVIKLNQNTLNQVKELKDSNDRFANYRFMTGDSFEQRLFLKTLNNIHNL